MSNDRLKVIEGNFNRKLTGELIDELNDVLYKEKYSGMQSAEIIGALKIFSKMYEDDVIEIIRAKMDNDQ